MTRFFALLAALGLILPVPGWSLNVVIKNQNTSYPDSQVYFTFKDAAFIEGTINGQPIVQDRAYAVTDIGSGITLQSFASGRIYFSLGAPLTGQGDPEPINSSVANWGTRFDKLELTFGPDPYGVANLTAIDYFAIPLAIKTYGGSTATGTPLGVLTYQQPGNTVAAKLGALTNNNAKVVLHDSKGNFLRVLGPTLSPSGAYPSFQPYLNAVQAAGQATQIKGLYSRAGDTNATKTQTYQFTATFDTSGNLQLVGGGLSYAGGPSVGPGHTILIKASDLALGIYSANPGYTVDGAAANIGQNDVYSAVVRDILTGYALGFVNSSVPDPQHNNVAFKDEISDNWWSSPRAFAYLQSNPAYYDQYAAYLQTISNAYGYPFSDRWQTVQVSLNPANVGTMELDVLPDVAPAMPVVTSAASAAAQLGTAFDYQIVASNSPVSYAAAGLPGGLTVNTGSGLISGTPTASGVFPVTLSATNGGGTGQLAFTLTVNQPFNAWQSANFSAAELQNPAVSGPLGDATGEGIPNLLKYALGISPRQAGVAGLPTVAFQNSGNAVYLLLTYTYNPLAADGTLTVQTSTDLQAWHAGTSYTTEISRIHNANGTQTVATRGNQALHSVDRQFLRLQASLATSP